MIRPMARSALLVVCLWFCVGGAAALAQVPVPVQVSSGVDPAEVTVGDLFRSVIRVDAPADVAVEFPEHLGVTEAYQSVADVEVLPGDDGDPHVAVYALVAWQTGTLPRPVAQVYLRLPDGTEQVLRVTLPMPEVRSVLPADTAGVEPRGAKGILEQPRSFAWWLAVALLLLLLALIILLMWWRRRRPATTVAPPARNPRAQAIAELEELRSQRLIERRQWHPFFSQLSDLLRRYAEAVSPRWSTDLTTGELLDAVERDGLAAEQALRLGHLLRQADLVKFARAQPGPDEADAAWYEARQLIDELESPDPTELLVSGGAGVAR